MTRKAADPPRTPERRLCAASCCVRRVVWRQGGQREAGRVSGIGGTCAGRTPLISLPLGHLLHPCDLALLWASVFLAHLAGKSDAQSAAGRRPRRRSFHTSLASLKWRGATVATALMPGSRRCMPNGDLRHYSLLPGKTAKTSAGVRTCRLLLAERWNKKALGHFLIMFCLLSYHLSAGRRA